MNLGLESSLSTNKNPPQDNHPEKEENKSEIKDFQESYPRKSIDQEQNKGK